MFSWHDFGRTCEGGFAIDYCADAETFEHLHVGGSACVMPREAAWR